MKLLSATIFSDHSFLGSLSCDGVEHRLCADSHHAPVLAGDYRPIIAIRIPSDNPLRFELGPKVALFRALSFAHLLALHSGLTDARGVPLPTDGSLSVGYEDIGAITTAMKKKGTVVLSVTERRLDKATKLLGVRASDEYMPRTVLRSIAEQAPDFAGDIWSWLAKHYSALGCTLCHKW